MLIIIQAQHITGPDQTATHFYSLHSWIGLVVCGLFALQVNFNSIQEILIKSLNPKDRAQQIQIREYMNLNFRI